MRTFMNKKCATRNEGADKSRRGKLKSREQQTIY